jgi:hypothetical protein
MQTIDKYYQREERFIAMAITREECFRKLYYRLQGEGRRLCKCTACGAGPISIIEDAVFSEPCWECEAVAWRELTEEEFDRESNIVSFSLSDYLASELEELDEATQDEPRAWIELQKELLKSLEGFSPEQSARWLTLNVERRREILANMFDELYTRDFLAKTKKVVERTMRLTAMIPKATPDHGVNLYLREATRCFIFGFWDSSVALSRATLELALKDRLKSKRLKPTDDHLPVLLDAAHKAHLIDGAHYQKGDRVRLDGKRVLHHGLRADHRLAYQTLKGTREVLNYLYTRL